MTDMTPEQAQIPATPVSDELPTAPVGDELPTAPVGDELPAAPVGDELPAAPVGDELPAAPVGDELPAAPVGEERGEERKEQGAPRMPRLPIPGMPMAMPTGMPGRVLWWGGLAALAVFDIVEWPVALLVGAGSWVAEQYAKADERAERQREESERTPFPG